MSSQAAGERPIPPQPIAPSPAQRSSSSLRAFLSLIRLSLQRQARAHLMVWIALGLLGLSALLVLVNTWNARWNMSYWRVPGGGGTTYGDHVRFLELAGQLPWDSSAAAVQQAAWGAERAVIYESSGVFVFTTRIVFVLFTTFLLPIWTVAFATEGLGREREAGNLIWVLTRPLSRPAVFLAKFVAILPWCIALNVGGFALLCHLAGWQGKVAFRLYWPAVLLGTFAFAALFHFLAALARRASIVAILYVFFLETVAGNLPGHLKRFSVSFYIRCLMFDNANSSGVPIRPERAHLYLPVGGAAAVWALVGMTVVLLVAGMWIFSRREYLDHQA